MDSSNVNIKNLFKYVMKFKYKIIKDTNLYDVLTIKYDNKEIKCKYLILFTIFDDKILWASDNIYNDNNNKSLVFWIKNLITEKNTNINLEKITTDDLKLLVKNIINLDNDLLKNYNTNALCVITENIKEYKQFYLITELLYF